MTSEVNLGVNVIEWVNEVSFSEIHDRENPFYVMEDSPHSAMIPLIVEYEESPLASPISDTSASNSIDEFVFKYDPEEAIQKMKKWYGLGSKSFLRHQINNGYNKNLSVISDKKSLSISRSYTKLMALIRSIRKDDVAHMYTQEKNMEYYQEIRDLQKNLSRTTALLEMDTGEIITQTIEIKV